MPVKHSNAVGNSYCQDIFLSPMWLCNPLFLFLVTIHLFSVIIGFSYDMKETLDIYSVSLMVDRSSITSLVILLHIHTNQIILEHKLIKIANHEWIIITIISNIEVSSLKIVSSNHDVEWSHSYSSSLGMSFHDSIFIQILEMAILSLITGILIFYENWRILLQYNTFLSLSYHWFELSTSHHDSSISYIFVRKKSG